ncbi:hypothetical protein [Streptomyces sp. AK08-02]|uniref:hypothetical protein n=1 Tax=Streptomyces sp. AK08-02 TaxID=3028654 RepID=UPI0029B09B15|nr:hypothetical protein [Streptomyces sp. AK08-02]MDX3752333.1 hypothetical protein [Streptomyces sp. AK08-02]
MGWWPGGRGSAVRAHGKSGARDTATGTGTGTGTGTDWMPCRRHIGCATTLGLSLCPR